MFVFVLFSCVLACVCVLVIFGCASLGSRDAIPGQNINGSRGEVVTPRRQRRSRFVAVETRSRSLPVGLRGRRGW